MRKILISICIVSAVTVVYGAKKEEHTGFVQPLSYNVKEITRRILSDVGSNFYNLFSMSTFYTGCAVLPLYVSARPIDHKIQKHFYDPVNHKNRHQPSNGLSKFAINTVAGIIPIVTLRDMLSRDPYHNRRGEVFITGLLLTWATKNILKLAHTEANIRPWHEKYSRHCRAYGGNPSGHSALFGYVASFWFAEKGPLVGVPLVLATGLAISVGVVTNRHYLSQVIMGTAYGVIFGLAAHKTLEKSVFSENTKVGLVANGDTGVGIKLSYNF